MDQLLAGSEITEGTAVRSGAGQADPPRSAETRAAEKLEGWSLPGRRSGLTWSVVGKCSRRSGFSVGYVVQNSKGTRAFLKATDIAFSRPKDGESVSKKLQRIMKLHTYERDILTICRGNGLDCIVPCIDEGEIVVDDEGSGGVVLYLVFELAKGDARAKILSGETGIVRAARALRQLATSLQQLHSAKITHNDIKPANLLIFGGGRYKLADLGRATSDYFVGPYDAIACAGDKRYAAPELLYSMNGPARKKVEFERRTAADLYALGSMAFFFLARRMLTPSMLGVLQSHHPELVPTKWTGDFGTVLPCWQQALRDCMADAEREAESWPIGNAMRAELLSAIGELCEPDVLSRGRAGRCPGLPRYSLEHYVSLFGRIHQEMAGGRTKSAKVV
jgi:eukaryotic-like serine/threonine-protein kinase